MLAGVVAAEPFESAASKFPPGQESLKELPRHLLHAMYEKNAPLWEASGVAEALADPGGSSERRRRNAVLALASFVSKQGDGWRTYF